MGCLHALWASSTYRNAKFCGTLFGRRCEVEAERAALMGSLR